MRSDFDSSHSSDRSCCSRFWSLRKLQVLLFLFALLAGASAIVSVWLPGQVGQQLQQGINKFVSLTPSSRDNNDKNWRSWVNTANPDVQATYYSVYLFNVTNAEAITHGAKAQVEQLGPYVFRQFDHRLNPEFSTDMEGHDILSYVGMTYYEFQPQLSGGLTMADKLVTVNIAFQLLGALDSLLEITQLQRTCYSSVMDEFNRQSNYTDATRFFASATVEEMLYGRDDPALSDCAALYMESKHFPNLGLRVPGLLANDTVESAMAEGVTSFFTGNDDNSLTRQYYSYEGQDYLMRPIAAGLANFIAIKYPFLWGANVGLPDGVAANRLHGTFGTQFQSGVGADQVLSVFIGDLMRSLYLIHTKDVKIKEITCYHYTLDPVVLYNSSQYPPNARFYQDKYQGFINLTAIYNHMPMFASKPHFLDCDSRVVSRVLGLAPSDERHDTFLDVEPITGATMNAHKRIQINLQMVAVPDTDWGSGFVDDLFMPIQWVDESGIIGDEDAQNFRSSVYLAKDLQYWIPIVGTIMTCLFMLLLLLVHCLAVRAAALQQRQAVNSSLVKEPLLFDARE